MFFYSTPAVGNFLENNAPRVKNPMADGILCLTYDDGPGVTSTPTGPGPRTDDLGFYLFLQGIPATFFVIGERAESEPDLCLQLMRWGHLVVTHTNTHIWMPWYADNATNDLINEVLDGTSHIGAAINPDSLVLRPPNGAWSKGVADVLNGDPRTRKFTGPIMGNLGAYDWLCWDNGQTPQNCADQYYNEINSARSGIIIGHDCAPLTDPTRVNINQTCEMTKLLIPRLIADGYRFLRLDALPHVRSAMQVTSIAGLKAANGLYLSPQSGGGGAVLANGPGLNAWEELGLAPLGGDNVAIRTPNGQFMSAHPNGDVLADGNGSYAWETFEKQDSGFGDGSITLKSVSLSRYVSAPNAGQISASATGVGPTERFILDYVAQ
jgi:peptidoglycan/xylan/chitin deacetylase (PgdA/CDA1 family)